MSIKVHFVCQFYIFFSFHFRVDLNEQMIINNWKLKLTFTCGGGLPTSLHSYTRCDILDYSKERNIQQSQPIIGLTLTLTLTLYECTIFLCNFLTLISLSFIYFFFFAIQRGELSSEFCVMFFFVCSICFRFSTSNTKHIFLPFSWLFPFFSASSSSHLLTHLLSCFVLPTLQTRSREISFLSCYFYFLLHSIQNKRMKRLFILFSQDLTQSRRYTDDERQ